MDYVMQQIGLGLLLGFITLSSRPQAMEAFNVGTTKAKVLSGPATEQFGYTVQQFKNHLGKWLLVGSPWSGYTQNRKGDVYKCDISQANCEKLHFPQSAKIQSLGNVNTNMSLGLTLTPMPGIGGFMTCGPLWAQTCGNQNFYPGMCATVDPLFRIQSAFVPALQSCGGPMDLVLVLDGSNSIYPWKPMNDFLRSLLPTLDIGPDRTQVSVIQYAVNPEFMFRLRDYRTKDDVIAAASTITQMYGHSTNTFQAIDFANDFGFLPVNGGRDGAAKVMVVVTDGESHDGAFRDRVISKCEKNKVTRFGIAVLGYYTRNNIDTSKLITEIKSIASSPTEKFFFNVSEEAALSKIAGTLGNRIFNIEGTGSSGEGFKMEMAQVGFSAHYAIREDVLMLGAVGAYGWSGTVVHKTGRRTDILPLSSFEQTLQDRNHGSLLGYSVTVLRDRGTLYYVAGAPRSNHSGQVITYTLDTQNKPTVIHSERGKQIGAYFGSVVCAVDVDDDDVTDLLLVGAPMFMSDAKREQGQVYLYSVTHGILSGRGTLHGSSHLENSRFGTAISATSDLNQDGFTDVVVGAPLEEEGKGVIYIYNGDKNTLRKQHSQRIPGAKLDSSLLYFGRSLAASEDMNDDSIPDVSVGAEGKVVQLWSMGVSTVAVTASFSPDKIDFSSKPCNVKGRSLFCFNAKVCFSATYRPRTLTGPVEITYNLTLDADLHSSHVSSRGMFSENNERTFQRHVQIGTSLCVSHLVHIQNQNVLDFVSPLGLRVDIGPRAQDGNPTLNAFSARAWDFSIPFTKICGADKICNSNLVLNVKKGPEVPSNPPMLVSHKNSKISFEVLVKNLGENAYNTHIFITFTGNLFYASISPPTDGTHVQCTSSEDTGALDCQVGYPAIEKNQQVRFMINFEFNLKNPQSKAQLDFEVKSESKEEKPTDNKAGFTIPVLYDTEMIMTKDSNINFYEVNENKTAKTTIKSFADIGPEFIFSLKVSTANFPVGLTYLTVSLPIKTFGGNPLLYVTGVRTQTREVVNCETSSLVNPLQIGTKPYTASFSKESLRGIQSLDCESAKCSTMKCVLSNMKETSDYFVNVTSRVWNGTFSSSTFQSTVLTVNADIETSEPDLLTIDLRHVQVELSIRKPGETADVPQGVIVGSVIGGLILLLLTVGLLWKFGFFKRKYKQLQKDMEMETQNGTQ